MTTQATGFPPLPPLTETLSRWTFNAPDGELLEAHLVSHDGGEGPPSIGLQVTDLQGRRSTVPVCADDRAPLLCAVNMALLALAAERAPPPSRLSRRSSSRPSRLRR